MESVTVTIVIPCSHVSKSCLTMGGREEGEPCCVEKQYAEISAVTYLNAMADWRKTKEKKDVLRSKNR